MLVPSGKGALSNAAVYLSLTGPALRGKRPGTMTQLWPFQLFSSNMIAATSLKEVPRQAVAGEQGSWLEVMST